VIMHFPSLSKALFNLDYHNAPYLVPRHSLVKMWYIDRICRFD